MFQKVVRVRGGSQLVMLSPVYPQAPTANGRGGWNLKQNQTCVECICASSKSVEGGNKRYPARGHLCNGSHKQWNKANDHQRHEEDGDKAVACHLSGVVGVNSRCRPSR